MQASAKAQSNIALVKYWGKRDVERNLPAVGSLSITLDEIWTTMRVRFGEMTSDTLSVGGESRPDMLPRVSRCLDRVAGVDRQNASIESDSNFPIGAGLASSASSFAALVVAANQALESELDRHALARLAGRASGSAARSLYGGFVLLNAGESDIDVAQLATASDWPLCVVIAITEEGAGSDVDAIEATAKKDGNGFATFWARATKPLESATQLV